LASANKGQPFFVSVMPLAPHGETRFADSVKRNPRPAKRHRDAFVDDPLPRPPSFNERDVSDKPEGIRNRPRLDRAERQRVRRWNNDRRASLLAVDDLVARLVETLAESGELDNTLFVFTSDNGFLLGEHRLRGKNQVYDENLQVPLLVRGPGVPSGETSTALAETVDLAPTILDAAGALDDVRRSGRVDGRSLLDLFRGERARPPSSTTLIQAGTKRRAAVRGNDGWAFRGVTTARYTYAEHFTGQSELYDRQVDPHELDNLLELRSGDLRPGAREYAEVLDALRSRLRDLRSCQGPAECDRRYPPLPDPR